MLEFTHWYNYRHKHSGIKFVTPSQRHNGKATAVMRQRKQVYKMAKANNPARWSGQVHIPAHREHAIRFIVNTQSGSS